MDGVFTLIFMFKLIRPHDFTFSKSRRRQGNFTTSSPSLYFYGLCVLLIRFSHLFSIDRYLLNSWLVVSFGLSNFPFFMGACSWFNGSGCANKYLPLFFVLRAVPLSGLGMAYVGLRLVFRHCVTLAHLLPIAATSLAGIPRLLTTTCSPKLNI